MTGFANRTGHDAGSILDELIRLPSRWHGAGTCGSHALRAIARHSPPSIRRSAETGTGKSTLLLSHLSPAHTVFTQQDDGYGDSLAAVQNSALLRRESVEFIIGKTQRTLPRHEFPAPLDLVLLDGPHAYPFPQLEYYFLYPHLAENGLLVIDDIHIPTIFHLFAFLREEAMFDLVEVVKTTAFFRRNSSPTFDPTGDGWWLQRYNERRFPVSTDVELRRPPSKVLIERARRAIPDPLKRVLRRLAGRPGSR